jgi:hypothetical protein
MTYNYNNSLLGDYLSPSGEHLVVENPIIIQSGSINNTTIGNTIPSSGYFSNLSVNGTGVSLTGHTHVVNDITDINNSFRKIQKITLGDILPAPITAEKNTEYFLSNADLVGPPSTSLPFVINDPPTGSPSSVGDSYVVYKPSSTMYDIEIGGVVYPKSSSSPFYIYRHLTLSGYTTRSWKTSLFSLDGHTHTSSDVTNFDISALRAIYVNRLIPLNSGLFVKTATSGTLQTTTISSNDITDFNSSVSGLLPVINNSGDNRILTSDGTSTGINAETRLTYSNDRRNALVVSVIDSSDILNPAKTCVLLNASLKTDPSSVSATIGNCETTSQLNIPSGSTINSGSLFGFAATVGRSLASGDAGVMGGSSSLIPFSAGYGHFPFGGEENDPVTNTVIGLNLVPFAAAGTINTHYAILIQSVASGVLEPVPVFGSGNIINSYGIFQQNSDPNVLNGSLTVNNGLSAPTPILNLGSVSGNVSVSYGEDKQIQKLTLNGTNTNLIKGSDWPTAFSADVLLEITVSSTTTVIFSIVDDWYNPVPAFVPGKYLVLLRSMGATIQGHYIGNKTN